MKRWFENFSTASARIAGQPVMLGLALILSITGFAAYVSGNEHFLGGASLGISTVTLILIPILQATQNRDGAALHAKIDELIKIHQAARDSLIGLEKRTNEEIEIVRQNEEENLPTASSSLT
jgi:low affinity Fe/Cu permease